MAGSASRVWQVEHCLCPLSPLGQSRSLCPHFSVAGEGFAGPQRGHGRWNLRQGASARYGFPKRSRPPAGEAIGRSKGGLTTKILAATDKGGRLIRYLLLPGNAAESPGLVPLVDGIATKGNVVIADKAYDSDRIRNSLAASGIIAVIPWKRNRKTPQSLDEARYRTRHLVENYFARIKQFRRIATRYDKTDTSFAAMIDLVAIILAI